MNKTINEKIQYNLDLMNALRNYNEDEGFVIIYIVDPSERLKENLEDSYYINSENEKVDELWNAEIFKKENDAIMASSKVSFGQKVTSTVISPAYIFVYDAIEKLKKENLRLLDSNS